MGEGILKNKSMNFAIRIVNLYNFLNELKQEMMAKNIICSDLSASNILKVRRGGYSKLVVIDGFGATELFPVCKYLKLFGKKKLERQWEKLERRIGLCLKC